MKLPPDVEFHEDIRLLIYRPRGLLDEASVDRVVTVLAGLETKLMFEYSENEKTPRNGSAFRLNGWRDYAVAKHRPKINETSP